MQIREFLKALSELREKGWVAKIATSPHDKYHLIELKKKGGRRKHKKRCPITAVCANLRLGVFDEESFELASDAIGLPRRLARIIAHAADDQPNSSKHMRKALLLALDL